MLDPLSNTAWKADGDCYELTNTVQDRIIWDSFFADSVHDRQAALVFCDGCPMQKRCLRFALETGQLWGVWGGRDESEIRRDLWMNANGTVGSRAKFPRCAWCLTENQLKVVDHIKHKIECQTCEFTWTSETTQQGIEANEAAHSTAS